MEPDSDLPIIKGPVDILKDNGLWVGGQDSAKGKSIDDPIVIYGVRNHKQMEFRVLTLLYRRKNSEFIIQGLCEKDGRKIDCMLMKVSNQDGSDEHYEKVYFDVTEGVKSL